MIEIKDECFYCEKKKGEHDPFYSTENVIVGYACRAPFQQFEYEEK